jgi:hypothetical protein
MAYQFYSLLIFKEANHSTGEEKIVVRQSDLVKNALHKLRFALHSLIYESTLVILNKNWNNP